MIVSSKFKLNASIDNVFKCLTDIDFVKGEIHRASRDERLKIHYDKKLPFKVGNRIILINGKAKLILEMQENIEPQTLSMNVWCEGKYKELVGMLYYKINLKQVGKKTICETSINRNEPLKGIFSIALKVYVWCAMFSSNRRLKKYVQSKST